MLVEAMIIIIEILKVFAEVVRLHAEAVKVTCRRRDSVRAFRGRESDYIADKAFVPHKVHRRGGDYMIKITINITKTIKTILITLLHQC